MKNQIVWKSTTGCYRQPTTKSLLVTSDKVATKGALKDWQLAAVREVIKVQPFLNLDKVTDIIKVRVEASYYQDSFTKIVVKYRGGLSSQLCYFEGQVFQYAMEYGTIPEGNKNLRYLLD